MREELALRSKDNMKFRRNEVDIKKFIINKEKIEKFRDDMSYMNIIPKDFSKKRLKICPICGEDVENWAIKSRWTLLDKMYDFTCPKCQSVLTIGESDITGLSYTAASICGQVKKMNNKEMREVYVKCKRIAKETGKQYLQGDEFTLKGLFGEVHLIKDEEKE